MSKAVKRVLFVCLGNICRSPAADGIFSKQARAAGLDIQVDSAGTSDWHIGNEPYDPMIRAAASRGYDLSPLRARQFTTDDFETFDLIIGMDGANVANMEKLRPEGNETPVRLFLDYASDALESEIPDPYYTGDYEQALDLIEAACDGLLTEIKAG